MMRRTSWVIALLLFTAATAGAEPYWIEWTGDAYPETEGWTREFSDPPAERWLEDGSLFIDSRADWWISEYYWYPLDGMMTLEEGETFLYHWRVRVDEAIVSTDPGAAIKFDDQYGVMFQLGIDRITTPHEPDMFVSFAPGEYHDFLFESNDMRTYSLCLDSELVWEGVLFESLFSGAHVQFGDNSSHRSLSAWDFAEFGIVPEPGSALALLTLVVLGSLKRSATAGARSANGRQLKVRRTER